MDIWAHFPLLTFTMYTFVTDVFVYILVEHLCDVLNCEVAFILVVKCQMIYLLITPRINLVSL